MAAHVQETVTNVVDAERGLVHQQRAVLMKTPRRDGGVDVLLARTVKTVRLVSCQSNNTVYIYIYIYMVE